MFRSVTQGTSGTKIGGLGGRYLFIQYILDGRLGELSYFFGGFSGGLYTGQHGPGHPGKGGKWETTLWD